MDRDLLEALAVLCLLGSVVFLTILWVWLFGLMWSDRDAGRLEFCGVMCEEFTGATPLVYDHKCMCVVHTPKDWNK